MDIYYPSNHIQYVTNIFASKGWISCMNGFLKRIPKVVRVGSFMLLVSTIMTACVSNVSKKAIRGEHSAIVSDSGQTNFATYSAYDHYQICEAFYHLQKLSELDDCMKALWPRASSEEFTVGVATYNASYVELLLSSIEARKYIDVGDVEKATEFANRAYQASQKKPRLVYNSLLTAYTSIFTLGMNNIDSEDSVHAQQDRFAAESEAAGLMAVAAEMQGRKNVAEKFRKVLWSNYQGFNKSWENFYGLNKIRRWLGRSHYVAGNYKAAYDVLTRDDRSQGEHALDGIRDAFKIIGTPVVESISLAVTGTTTEEAIFYQNMPMRVMLYRSAYKSNHLDIARAGYDNLLADKRIANFANLHFRLLHERALIAKSQGDTKASESLMKQAIQLLENQRASLDKEDYRMGFIGGKVNIYGDLVNLLSAAGRHKEAFEYVERAKARALVEMLASRQNFAGNTDTTSSTELIRELGNLEYKSIQLASAGDGNVTTRGAKINAARSALRSSSPELASLVSASEIDVTQIQQRLKTDETLLEFFGHGDDLYAFIVKSNSIEAIQLDGKNLAGTVTELRSAVQRYPSKAYVDLTRRMYDRLIRPAQNKLTGKMLTIVPHGPLHYLPFAALSDGRKYLIEKFDIRLLPSASVLQYLDKKGNFSQELLALGNPDLGDPKWDLPGAQAETRAIDQGWKGSRILLRELASEANFKKFAPQFKYLHLASHGQFNPDQPLQSRMLLAPGDGEDGNLNVDELYTLRLNADMVTLSACETALGNIKSGEDVIGLTRGFLYAGAKSIVASLWPVSDDATAYLMKRFYAELKTTPKATALRSALVDTKSKFPHPIFWSAFQLTGAVN